MRIARFFVAVWLWSVCGLALAQSQAVAVTYGTAGGNLAGGAITTASPSDFTRLIQGGATLGDVAIRDGARARVGSVDVDMVLQRRMPWVQVGRAAAAVGRTLPYVATAVAFIDLMNSIRLRSDGASWNRDPGVPPTTTTGKFWGPNATGVVTSSSIVTAGNTRMAQQCTAASGCNPIGGVTCTVSGSHEGNCTYQWQSNVLSDGTRLGPYSASIGMFASDTTMTECPASVDALNPANSIPAGRPPGYDGRCTTGRYTEPKTETEAGDLAIAHASKAAAAAAVASMLGRGVDLAPRTDTPTASGPGTVAQPTTTTTTTGPNGTTTGASSPTAIVVYNGPNYTWNDSTVTTTTNGGGTTTTTTNAPPPATVETCGLPGKPACKIDETGTPSVIPPFSTTPIDATKTSDAAKQDTEIGRVINPGFGWFSVPPMATCAPIGWPGGVQINPCNGIEVVRSIMAYLWALYGAVWSFGVFRRSLPGAA